MSKRSRSQHGFGSALIAGLGLVVATGAVVALPSAVPTAGAATTLVTATPVLTPRFDPAVTDYTARCGKSRQVPTVVTLQVHAPSGTAVSIAGSAPRTGSFVVKVSRAWDQSFPFAVTHGHTAPVRYVVRCRGEHEPAIGAIRTRASTAGYYLMSAHGLLDFGDAGTISTADLDVVDTDGVPVWWFNANTQVGEAQVLPNGNLAYIPVGRPLEERRFDGTLVATAQLADAATPAAAAPDLHDFEHLPNGDWLLTGYPVVSGLDLSSIGGAANTCAIDAEVEEVTPGGALVWSWLASQHVSPTEINPNVQPTANLSTCDAPRDLWHMNSVQAVSGGDFIVSLRQTDAVWRIHAATGAVQWKLGGSPDAKSLTILDDPLLGPIGQHDARMWNDGTVSVFDNGDDSYKPPGRRRSRVVRYKIDTAANTATLVETIVDPFVSNPIGAGCCGSARRLPGGHWAISYGAQGINTEVTASGKRVLSANYGDTSSDSANPKPALFTYRMDPVAAGVLSRDALRAAMDGMHPVKDTKAPALVAAGTRCTGRNGWCRSLVGTFDAFDNVALPKKVCRTATVVAACRFTVTATKDGANVKVSTRVCDAAATRHCSATVTIAGTFRVDHTAPRVSVSATTADGKAYKPGTATHQAVTVRFACTDATSGVASGGCPAPVTVAHPSGNTLTRVATDKAGNSKTVKITIG